MSEMAIDGALSENTEKRLRRTLEQFDALPDTALVDVRVVGAVRGRSRASTWRDVQEGRLAQPIKLSPGCTRWRVGDLRTSIKVGMQNNKRDVLNTTGCTQSAIETQHKKLAIGYNE